MSVYRKLDKAVDEAKNDAEAKHEPHAVIEWYHPAREYHVRSLVKAQHLVAKHPDALIKVVFYPKAGTLEGEL